MKTEELKKVIEKDPDYFPPTIEVFDMELEYSFLTPISGEGYPPPTGM